MSYVRVLPSKGYAEVVLTQGKVAKISLEDVERVSLWSWHAVDPDRKSKTKKKLWYASTKINGKTVYMHRFIMNMQKLDNFQVDHINNDTLDNRRENLQVVAHKENQENRAGAYTSSKTGIRGVSVQTYKNSHPTYIAKVMKDYKGYSKAFPMTEEGLEQATVFAEELRRQLFTNNHEPVKDVPEELTQEVAELIHSKQAGKTRRDSQTGEKHIWPVTTRRGDTVYNYWQVKWLDAGGKWRYKSFPQTDEGLAEAKTFLENKNGT